MPKIRTIVCVNVKTKQKYSFRQFWRHFLFLSISNFFKNFITFLLLLLQFVTWRAIFRWERTHKHKLKCSHSFLFYYMVQSLFLCFFFSFICTQAHARAPSFFLLVKSVVAALHSFFSRRSGYNIFISKIFHHSYLTFGTALIQNRIAQFHTQRPPPLLPIFQ